MLLVIGCESSGISATSETSAERECDLPTGGITSGTARGVIQALTNPPITEATDQETSYLDEDSRVIGLFTGDAPLAVPLSVLHNHEIANFDDWSGRNIAVTYCPNTGSSLAFDRNAVAGAEFEVAGVLLHENLVMLNKQSSESLWPQMSRTARCGPARGASLEMVPIVELTWKHWTSLHPDTKIVASSVTDNPHEPSQESEERVLGIPEGDGLALPFSNLNDGPAVRVIEADLEAKDIVVFWKRDAQGAMAFHPTVGEDSLSFTTDGNKITDRKTNSVWTIDGRAVEGPRRGARLDPVQTAYVAHRSAWLDFHPATKFWTQK